MYGAGNSGTVSTGCAVNIFTIQVCFLPKHFTKCFVKRKEYIEIIVKKYSKH